MPEEISSGGWQPAKPSKRFMALWEAADFPPNVFEFVAAQRTLSVREVADVLLVDQSRRWGVDQGLLVEEYFQKLPEIATNQEVRLQLILGELRSRRQRGEILKIDTLLIRFPQDRQALLENLQQSEFSHNFQLGGLTLKPANSDSSTAFSQSRQPIPSVPHIDSVDHNATTLLALSRPFTTLPSEIIELLESNMYERTFEAGEFLMRQGEVGTSLMIISQGIVEIFTEDEDGHRHLQARTGRGQIFGEMALLTEEPRSANVVAVSPVRALVLPAARFHKLASEHPCISVILTQLVATRLGSQIHDVLAGKTFKGYRIVRRLGRGGMAIVYEAIETSTGQRVALKMMSHRLVYESAALAQFQREADLIESFQHENIVQVHGRFKAFRTYFLVMPFLDGQTLSKLIQTNGPLPESEFRKIIAYVSRAMAYAHHRDVIHGDIKPANIMVGRDGTVKLMDFGLARPVIDTMLEGIVGTPRYMAPEQLLGYRAGKQSDYFSLGCVAYEMLTGKPLLPEQDIAGLIHHFETWQPPDFRTICPPLSSEVCHAFQHSLHKSPEIRRLNLDQLATWAGAVDVGRLMKETANSAEGDAFESTVIE